MAYRPERGWGFGTGKDETRELRDELAELRYRISVIENGTPGDALPARDSKGEVSPWSGASGRRSVMELLLAAIYIAFCWMIFKIFRIPVNQWSLATATLGGIIGIVLLLLVMNYNHPFTTQARIYFTVTPILPGVRGRVVEVPVTPNAPLKEGDVLFKLDPRPFEYMVDQKKAELAEAEQNVKQLKASLDQADRGKREDERAVQACPGKLRQTAAAV